MRYEPPFIFAHRVYYERGEKVIEKAAIEAIFGPTSFAPAPEHRWLQSRTELRVLQKMKIDMRCHGMYIGFRTQEDQMLFYMTFQGKI